MNKITAAITSVVTVFGALYLFSMTLSPKWEVQRSVYINANPDSVVKYVNSVSGWKKWNNFAAKRGFDSVKAINGKENSFNYLATSEKTGTTEKSTIRLIRSNFGTYVYVKVEGKTETSPLTRYLMLMHSNIYSDELQKDLAGLKHSVEKR